MEFYKLILIRYEDSSKNSHRQTTALIFANLQRNDPNFLLEASFIFLNKRRRSKYFLTQIACI